MGGQPLRKDLKVAKDRRGDRRPRHDPCRTSARTNRRRRRGPRRRRPRPERQALASHGRAAPTVASANGLRVDAATRPAGAEPVSKRRVIERNDDTPTDPDEWREVEMKRRDDTNASIPSSRTGPSAAIERQRRSAKRAKATSPIAARSARARICFSVSVQRSDRTSLIVDHTSGNRSAGAGVRQRERRMTRDSACRSPRG